jgi:hypothetical protein
MNKKGSSSVAYCAASSWKDGRETDDSGAADAIELGVPEGAVELGAAEDDGTGDFFVPVSSTDDP